MAHTVFSDKTISKFWVALFCDVWDTEILEAFYKFRLDFSHQFWLLESIIVDTCCLKAQRNFPKLALLIILQTYNKINCLDLQITRQIL